MIKASPTWRRLLLHDAVIAVLRAAPSAGRSIPISKAIIEITTRSSIKVKALSLFMCIEQLFVSDFLSVLIGTSF